MIRGRRTHEPNGRAGKSHCQPVPADGIQAGDLENYRVQAERAVVGWNFHSFRTTNPPGECLLPVPGADRVLQPRLET